MSVIVQRLTVVGIHAETHHVVFHHGTVWIDIVVGICFLRERHRRDALVLGVLFRAVAYADVAIRAAFVLAWLALLRQRDGECLFLLLRHVGHEGKFFIFSIIIKVVQLTWNFLAVKSYECRTNVIVHFDNYRYGFACLIRGIFHRDGHCLISRSILSSRQQGHYGQ